MSRAIRRAGLPSADTVHTSSAPMPASIRLAHRLAPCVSSMLITAARRPGQRNSSALACQ
jgi:hypothetical protein